MKQHPEISADLETLLRWAKRGQGWAFREYPPMFKRLPGGCTLVVIVPTLWRPRVGPRPRPVCAPIDFAAIRAKRPLATAGKPDSPAIAASGAPQSTATYRCAADVEDLQA